VNFLDQIWLIPLFPLFGAALMFLFGKCSIRSRCRASRSLPAWNRSTSTDTITGTRRIMSITGARMTITAATGITRLAAQKADQHHLPRHGAAVFHLFRRRGVAA
jgi:hypothetical protein